MNAKLLHRSRLFVKKNASTILTGMGAAGVVATTVMAVKATPKAMVLLEAAKEEKGEELTKLEKVYVAAPVYIPAVLIGAGTIACIFGANALNKRQQAALMSAYALLDNSYKEYKKKVEDLYGKEVDGHIKAEIAKDKYELSDIFTDEDAQLYYDEYSGRYFESTAAKVKQAEYNVNRLLRMKGYACLNDFYEELGMELIYSGYDLGWTPSFLEEHAWQSWLDFNHQKVILDDGLEVYIVSFYTDPTPNFLDFA